MNVLEHPDCFVCSKHAGQIDVPGGAIYEDDLAYIGHLFRPNEKVYLGYCMVEPKRHAPDLADLTNEEAQRLGLLVTRLTQALKACIGAEHICSFVLGDHVPHLHIHVVPRYPGAPRQYWGIHVDEWPDAPRGGTQDIDTICERLRTYMKRDK